MAPDQAPPASGGQEIVLDNVTKTYPDQDQPAVDRVSMTIPAGEIVVLVGPSGCGKTTTMKMINRLIEPSAGRITIGGTDVLKLDVDQHRRSIGYVIQQIGLFPHMRVRENIGLVPGLVGWERARIAARVDELLELVGLSAEYGRRYPRELSGGQQQRVGVARALAADPPVMLMDEPFGATDPITREHLQDEFRRLQLQLRKTIVFVTHDFAEALKLGDRIAVLRPQSVIAQYDTPTEILARPADAYVESFIGAGPNLKKLTLLPLRGATLEPVGRDGSPTPVVDADGSLHDALDVLLGSGSDAVAVVENGGRPLGLLRMTELLRIARGDRDDGRLARHAAGPCT